MARTKRTDTYAGVQRIVKEMRRLQVPEAVIATERARLLDHVRLRYNYKADLQRSVIVPDAIRAELDRIAQRVLAKYLMVSDLAAPRRLPAIVSARKVFLHVARACTVASYPELAVYLRKPGKHPSLIFAYQHASEAEKILAGKLIAAEKRDRKLERKARAQ